MCATGTVESSTTNRGQILINGFDLLRKGLFCAVLFFWCYPFHCMKKIWVYVCTRNPSTNPLPHLSISEPLLLSALTGLHDFPPLLRFWAPRHPSHCGAPPYLWYLCGVISNIFYIGIFGRIPNMWWMTFCRIFSWWYLVGSQICRRYLNIFLMVLFIHSALHL